MSPLSIGVLRGFSPANDVIASFLMNGYAHDHHLNTDSLLLESDAPVVISQVSLLMKVKHTQLSTYTHPDLVQ